MDNISSTRLSKEREILSQMQSKHTKIVFPLNSRTVEVTFLIFNTPVTYYIILPERYPFLSPKIESSIPSSLTSLYTNSENIVEFILKDQWSPAINLQNIIEKLYTYSQSSLSQRKTHDLGRIGLIGAVLLSLTIRTAMFSQSFSGYNSPPRYGDYEAQRHWMEITLYYPSEQWYKDIYTNEDPHWGLDYPPLTAWHSYLCGLLSSFYEPDSMTYYKSRGYYTLTHLLFMRSTVLISELFTHFVAVLLYFFWFYSNIDQKIKNTALLMVLLSPPIILIDFGHFQYNTVMLGFALLSIVLSIKGHYAFSAISLALSVNFKIMALYYSLPFAVYWAGSALDLSAKESYKYSVNIRKLAKYGFFVNILLGIVGSGAVTCMILWTPWLSFDDIFIVLKRIFPISRGVFQDKVASFWFVLTIFFKFQNFLSVSTISAMTAVTTLIMSCPFLFLLWKHRNPQSFLLSLSGVSLSFYLFSYHVHEKTILVPLLPITFATIFNNPMVFQFSIILSTFSMYPLLVQDGLVLPYFVLQTLFYVLSGIHIQNIETWTLKSKVYWWYVGICGIHLLETFKPPEKYPHLFHLIVTVYSFIGFCYIWVVLLKSHYKVNESVIGRIDKEKIR